MAQHRDLIVIGASAGGVQAVRSLLAGLPRDLSAAVVVAIHSGARGKSHLATVLGARSTLPAEFARDDEPLRPGQVYVAPPGHDVFVLRDHLHVVRCPTPSQFRPSIDALFISAAASYGPRVIGVVLSGTLDDGVVGMTAIKRGGGLAVVQQLADAQFPDMPQHVMDAVKINYAGTARDLGPALGRFVLA